MATVIIRNRRPAKAYTIADEWRPKILGRTKSEASSPAAFAVAPFFNPSPYLLTRADPPEPNATRSGEIPFISEIARILDKRC
jgi:hypothetical protein